MPADFGPRLKLGKWQGRALRVGGSAALIVGIFWFIPFADVIAALREINIWLAAVGLLLMLTSAYLEAIALWLPLNRVGIKTSSWTVFEVKMISRFYGQFLPSELLASFVKLHRLAGPTKQWAEVVAGLAYTRLVNMLVLALLGLVFWAIEMPTGPGRWVGVLLGGMSATLVGIHLTIVSPAVNRLAQRVFSMRIFNLFRGGLTDKFVKLAQTMVESYRLFGDTLTTVTLLAVVRHLMGIFGFSVIALSLDIHLSYVTVGWIRVVLHAVMMLPISLSGIGVREGSLVILLQEYSVPPSEAVALAFLLFALTLVANALGGMFELRGLLVPRQIDDSTEGRGSK